MEFERLRGTLTREGKFIIISLIYFIKLRGYKSSSINYKRTI